MLAEGGGHLQNSFGKDEEQLGTLLVKKTNKQLYCRVLYSPPLVVHGKGLRVWTR